ncbi:hypothetical protein KKB18_06430, partial [bacterium]|nr:hypothetical protein [bacterium]
MIILFISAAVIEKRTPFGVRTEYYQLFGGEYALQFNNYLTGVKMMSKSKFPDSRFELEYTAIEDGFNLSRIQIGNLENLKKIPHGIIWSGYLHLGEPKGLVMNINYSGLIVVMVDDELMYANIGETKTEKLTFGLKDKLIPFKIAYYTGIGAGDFALSVSGKEGTDSYYLTTQKIQGRELEKAVIFFKIINYIKIISIMASLCLIAYLTFLKLYRGYRRDKKIPVLTKVFLGSFIFYFILS